MNDVLYIAIMFNSIHDFNLLKAATISQLWQPNHPLDITKHPWRKKTRTIAIAYIYTLFLIFSNFLNFTSWKEFPSTGLIPHSTV